MKKFLSVSALFSAVLATGGFASMAMAQDECSTAVVATAAAPTAFNTATATPSANAIPLDTFCTGTFLNWQATQKDVWMKYTPTESGTATFSTCLIGSYDTSMAIYTGTCAALTEIACSGDGPTDGGCQNYYSIVTNLTVTAGTTYTIRLGGYNGATGTGQLAITFVPIVAGCGSGGGCGVVHATPGCSDGVCCTAVCAANPLCCEIGWDDTCVQSAVAACGLFIYTCNQGSPANDCATNAVVVAGDSTLASNNVGAIQDGPNYGTACGSGNNSSNNDVWWRVNAVANGALTVSTCGLSPYDSKLAIYDMGTSPATFDYNTLNLPTVFMGCNDDGAGSCLQTDGITPYASLLSVTVSVGHSYLVNLSTYTAGETGVGQISFNVPEPCSLPSTTSSEGETCGASTNAGCVGTVSTTTPIALGASVGGSFWADAGTRDVDWYSFTLATDKTVTASVFSASNVAGFMFKGDSCTGQLVGQMSNSCPSTGTWCLPAGNYSIAVATAAFTGTPCGSGVFNNYVLQLNGVAATCPSYGDTCSYTTTTVSQNTDSVATNYAFGCLLWCGTNESTFSTATNFARSFSDLNSGSLGCVTVGVANQDVQVDGSYAGGAPFAFTLGLYRDTDGGNPTTVGGDLVLVTQKQFTALGGFQLLTWNLDTPLSLTGNTQPLVVVMSGVVNGGCTASGNGIFGGVGNATGSTAPWFEQSIDPNNICNDAAFVAQTGTSQWIVNLGMVSAPACPTDVNGDGITGSADLSVLLNGWGTASPDLNGDGIVGSADLSVMLNGWGACP
jgi:hypothetical protein